MRKGLGILTLSYYARLSSVYVQIIPVIDLKNGIVVHAKHGNRDDYAALQSNICKSADIFDVVESFWELFRFPTLYIADLNAITGQGHNADLLSVVLAAFPAISFWVDGGYPLSAGDFISFPNFLPVLGSESFDDENVGELINFGSDFILSLDYSATGEMGAKSIFANQELWPDNIIIMNLPKVGSNAGPDIKRLSDYRKHYPEHNFIAAGGVRDKRDLTELSKAGVRQALVATALHNGNISPADI